MAMPNQVITILARHIGKGNGISVEILARQLGIAPRQVRKHITALRLRDDGHAICGMPKDGYYMAETPEELKATCDFLHNRAMHSLALKAKLMKIPLADLLGQLHLPT